jgi:hypothetical protein
MLSVLPFAVFAPDLPCLVVDEANTLLGTLLGMVGIDVLLRLPTAHTII